MADRVYRRLGKSHLIRSGANGFSGGVWCLWNKEEVEVNLKSAHNSFLHMSMRSSGGKKWNSRLFTLALMRE